jgi:uncharacterized membrane protein
MLATSMSTGFARPLTVACAIGAGLVAGVYFAFSTFVLRGLRTIQPAAGMSAMQSINKAAPNPLFMIALLGTGVGCIVLAVVAGTRWGQPSAPWALAGALLYVASLVLTMAYHVPRNDALDLVDPTGPDAAARWQAYLSEWVPWNHVRTALALAGAIAMTVSLIREG